MSAEIDEAYQRLTGIQSELTKALAHPTNEAGIRFRVLDRILTDVLGWPHDRITVEESTLEGFSDYTLRGLDGSPTMIIEAKRSGKLQPVSAAVKSAAVSLSGKVAEPLIPAVKQGIGYASWLAAPLVCVTDGQTWFVLQANRRDRPPLDGHGILFPSFQTLVNEFPKFHDLMSVSGQRDRLALAQLHKAEGVRPATAEEQIIVSPASEAKMRKRDTLSDDASLLFRQFFSKISAESDPDMLRACFVETAESKKADLEIQKIAQKLISSISNLDTGKDGAFQAEVERAISAMQSDSILLIGNKGAGKSTFLTRFFTDILPANVSDKSVIVRVPLDAFTGDESELVGWAVRRLRDELEATVCASKPPTYDELQGVFWGEYDRQRKGSGKHLYESNKTKFKIEFGMHIEKLRTQEPSYYIARLLDRCVHSDRKLPILIFDNADQFSPAIQDNIFQLAYSFGVECPVLNIVPITDRTVWRLSKAGAIQSYSSKSFYLPVPEAKQILSKRIDYINSRLAEEPNLSKQYFSSKGFRVQLDNIGRFAEAVDRLFVKNDFVSGLIGQLANFDIRRMLKIAERVFLSPEIQIDEVLKTSFGFAPGRAELHRIHRGLVKGEYDRYDERENEYVLNLFWSDPNSPASPLLTLYLLMALKQRSAATDQNDIDARMIAVSDLCSVFEVAGAQRDQTQALLQRLLDRGLVEPLNPTEVKIANGQRLSITEAGLAHIELAFGSTVYIEQMAMATGLNSRTTFNSIRDLRQKQSQEAFAELRKTFVDYLIEIDTLRIKFPSSPEYAGLAEARKRFRGLGHTNLGASKLPSPIRTEPLASLGDRVKSSRFTQPFRGKK
ncbi:hypothetical protein OIU13_14170 [Brevundimonas sp. BT-123]|uniref:hypothetical protein n=1 Tax=Brevundimonas sp. BT-123 TaxID=2986928 RepID=UPI0022358CB0|nr:hypothetical protein [Brevundimonas sp. BT-123]MCW0047674.1 hypothetical protein [Brevundimonas sp. BT-123]